MTHHLYVQEHECCCGCVPEVVPPVCETCAPKMYLTPEEEAILARMRGLKEQVRTVTARLRTIKEQFAGEDSGPAQTDAEREWKELRGLLKGFRHQWKEWEEKLDDAIEQKLIALGHRDPK